MQEAGLVCKGEVVMGKIDERGGTFVAKVGYPGTGKRCDTWREGMLYAEELLDNDEDN